jgi:hypothetical protein
MLTRILAAIRTAGRPLCLADLQRQLDLDASALEGMLETLVARGRLGVERYDDPGCGGCPIKSGCFLMASSVSATYALSDETKAGHAAVGAAPASPERQAVVVA